MVIITEKRVGMKMKKGKGDGERGTTKYVYPD